MTPLLDSFKPVINGAANRYIRNPKYPLHPEIIRAQFKTQFAKAMDSFDPKRGVQLNTHVFNTLRKATRFLIRHQNLGAIPEVRALRARDFLEGRSSLTERLGREPNHTELSNQLKWSPPEVRRMEAELRQTSPTMDWEDEPTGIQPSREAEVISMVKYDLNGEEKLVYEYLFGMGGKPKSTPGDIARNLKWTPSKVTRIKNRIVERIDRYI